MAKKNKKSKARFPLFITPPYSFRAVAPAYYDAIMAITAAAVCFIAGFLFGYHF